MKFPVNNNLVLPTLFTYLAGKHTVEIFESVNALLSGTSLSLKPEYCFAQADASYIILIDHNIELMLAIDIENCCISNIQADTIDAAMIANDAIEYGMMLDSYYGEEDFYPEREQDNEDYADETFVHDFNA